MTQCKTSIKVEGKRHHLLFCLKDEGHEGLHEVYLMPLSESIILAIKELLWYRWIPIRKQPKIEEVVT